EYFVNNWLDNMPWNAFFPEANINVIKANIIKTIDTMWPSQNLKAWNAFSPKPTSTCDFSFGSWLPQQLLEALKTYFKAFSPPQTIEEFYTSFIKSGILEKMPNGDYVLTAKGIKTYIASEKFKANYFG
ncbi:MAG: hypothetical protein QW063_02090, partial [Candidatus Nanoarchaeia archaeon]